MEPRSASFPAYKAGLAYYPATLARSLARSAPPQTLSFVAREPSSSYSVQRKAFGKVISLHTAFGSSQSSRSRSAPSLPLSRTIGLAGAWKLKPRPFAGQLAGRRRGYRREGSIKAHHAPAELQLAISVAGASDWIEQAVVLPARSSTSAAAAALTRPSSHFPLSERA